MKKNPIEEARRYVDNAKQTLTENGKLNMETHRYEDPKYVRAAGNYLWLGVLIHSYKIHNRVKRCQFLLFHRFHRLFTIIKFNA